MKSVIAKIQIQFDIFPKAGEDDMKKVFDTLHEINSILLMSRHDGSPCIFVNALDESDVEIAEEEIKKEIYEIKITGSGTPDEITNALKKVLSEMEMSGYNNAFEVANEKGKFSAEDPTLMTEISEE
jgi:hypothetical protein